MTQRASMDGDSDAIPGFPRTSGVVARGIADRLHLGVQLYVAIDGATLADVGVGQAQPGTALTADTIMPWLSAGKPAGAIAIARLWERGALELDDPATRFIPEFGTHGKAGVTIRHLLTHTGGFRGGIRARPDAPWDEVIARICDMRLEPRWIPGQRAGYHSWTSWFILAEIVHRAGGREYSRVVREEIFEPAGMSSSWIGIPPEARAAYGDRFGILYDTSRKEAHQSEADAEALGRPYRPGGSGRGPMRELGRFYEMLRARGRLGDTRLLLPQTVEALTARHRAGMFDQTFRCVMDWGLGFVLDSKMYGPGIPYGYGRHASSRTFGHSGRESSCAFCDPERGLVVAWAANGMPGDPRHQARAAALNEAIYEDLGLAQTVESRRSRGSSRSG
ncbi:MAG TPA: serine hydrolase domain-containing protein [bacterium]|nr:serine hydrolase domain-containing protein [bacterium]